MQEPLLLAVTGTCTLCAHRITCAVGPSRSGYAGYRKPYLRDLASHWIPKMSGSLIRSSIMRPCDRRSLSPLLPDTGATLAPSHTLHFRAPSMYVKRLQRHGRISQQGCRSIWLSAWRQSRPQNLGMTSTHSMPSCRNYKRRLLEWEDLPSSWHTFRVALKLGRSLIEAHRLAQLRRKMAGVATTVLSALLSAG